MYIDDDDDDYDDDDDDDDGDGDDDDDSQACKCLQGPYPLLVQGVHNMDYFELRCPQYFLMCSGFTTKHQMGLERFEDSFGA